MKHRVRVQTSAFVSLSCIPWALVIGTPPFYSC